VDSGDKFICQLVASSTSATNLQIYPRYKTRSEGELVFFDDKVTIMHKSGGGQYIGFVTKNNLIVSYDYVTEGW
jgi:hypothetical protein